MPSCGGGNGVKANAASIAARELTDQGCFLIRPNDIGWDDIRRFENELQKGQSVLEDAGDYFVRAIVALFGKTPAPAVLTYQDAAE